MLINTAPQLLLNPSSILGRNECVRVLSTPIVKLLTSLQWRKSTLHAALACCDLDFLSFLVSQDKSEASEAGSQAAEEDYDVEEEYDNDYADDYFDNGEGDDLDDLGGGGAGDPSGGGFDYD